MGKNTSGNYSGPLISDVVNDNFSQGNDNTLVSGADRCFAQGNTNSVSGNNSFAQGDSNTIGSSNCFAQGNSNTLTSDTHYALCQGEDNYMDGEYTFAQGYDVSVSADASFGQGNTISVTGARSFAQGYNQTVSGDYSFAQGEDSIVSGSYSFAQGEYINIYSDNSFGQGYQCYLSANSDQTFMQGDDINASGLASGSENNFFQGQDFTISGACDEVFAQGEDITITGVEKVFAQGDDITVTGSYSFAQGDTLIVSADRTFVQGAYASATQSDQKVWGSNRTSPQAGAQSSHIIKYLQTTDATTANLATIATATGKSYVISCHIIARNAVTAAETASFVLSQATVYNDAGSAVLVGSPTFNGDDSGGGAAAWTAVIDVNTADVRIRITGDATDNVEWCCDLAFVEVASVVI